MNSTAFRRSAFAKRAIAGTPIRSVPANTRASVSGGNPAFAASAAASSFSASASASSAAANAGRRPCRAFHHRWGPSWASDWRGCGNACGRRGRAPTGIHAPRRAKRATSTFASTTTSPRRWMPAGRRALASRSTAGDRARRRRLRGALSRLPAACPILISSMTGGTARAAELNLRLAELPRRAASRWASAAGAR